MKKIVSKDAVRGSLSHFVAPLYVAPSTTPGNAKPTSECVFAFVFVSIYV